MTTTPDIPSDGTNEPEIIPVGDPDDDVDTEPDEVSEPVDPEVR